jgi:hypothetical protein
VGKNGVPTHQQIRVEISKSNRIADLTKALQFGNHNGASQKLILLKKLISDDIRHGYGLVIPQEKISCLPDACLAPMNIMKQFTLEIGREIVDKEHLIQDQSFKWQSRFLVNPTMMHVRTLPDATAVLDSSNKEKVSKCTNCTPED